MTCKLGYPNIISNYYKVWCIRNFSLFWASCPLWVLGTLWEVTLEAKVALGLALEGSGTGVCSEDVQVEQRSIHRWRRRWLAQALNPKPQEVLTEMNCMEYFCMGSHVSQKQSENSEGRSRDLKAQETLRCES